MVVCDEFQRHYDVILFLSATGEGTATVRLPASETRKSTVCNAAAAKIKAKMNKSLNNEAAPEARQRIHLLAEHE